MSPSVVADLHSHTTASDGTLTIEEIPTAAKEAGINWVAVTVDLLLRVNAEESHHGISGRV